MSFLLPRAGLARNVALLAICQTLFNTAMSMNTAMASLIGHDLATDKTLATLPITATVIGNALVALPVALFMQRYGRARGFGLAALIGMIGGFLAAYGIMRESFILFTSGCFLFGIFGGTALYYRFAAADMADDTWRSRAIAWVLAGGVVAAFIAPQLATMGKDLIADHPFLGAYLVCATLCFLTLIILKTVHFSPMRQEIARDEGRQPPRSLPVLLAQPAFLAALVSGMVGYASMSFLMTATPLSMVEHHHYPFAEAAFVIQWHVFGMFAPSFFSGSLIARFGAPRIIMAGIGLNLICCLIALHDQTVLHYTAALALLGVGWNFTYVGSTSWLTQSYRPEERGKAQGFNDFMVSGFTALASFSSGALLHRIGWNGLVWTAIPLLILAGMLVFWGARGQKTAKGA